MLRLCRNDVQCAVSSSWAARAAARRALPWSSGESSPCRWSILTSFIGDQAGRSCDKASFRVRVAEAIRGDDWVVDGSFSELALDLTLARADTLIVIERPRWLCQWRIAWRSAFDRSGPRPDLPEGCPEKFDWNDAGGVALRRRPSACHRGRTREVWRACRDRSPDQRLANREFRGTFVAATVNVALTRVQRR